MPLAVFAACIGPFETDQAGVDVETDRTSYTIGGLGEIRVTNVGSRTVWHHGIGCSLLFQRVGDDWKQIGSHSSQACVVIAYPSHSIAPGEAITATFPIDESFTPGVQYRFTIVLGSEGRRVHSNPFTIRSRRIGS